MDDDDEGKVKYLIRPKPGIRELLGLPPNQVETADDDGGEKADYAPPPKKSDPLPKPGDPYRACAKFLNRLATEQRLIHFVDRQCFSEGYSYHDLRGMGWRASDDPGGGPVLVLRFVEAVVTEVEIHGRNLEDIRYYIGQGLMPWVWEQPKSVKTKECDAVSITDIMFTKTEK